LTMGLTDEEEEDYITLSTTCFGSSYEPSSG